jgi:hypothetical protein
MIRVPAGQFTVECRTSVESQSARSVVVACVHLIVVALTNEYCAVEGADGAGFGVDDPVGGVILVLALVAVPVTPALSVNVTVMTTDVMSVLSVAALSLQTSVFEVPLPPAGTDDENALLNVQLPVSPVRDNDVFTDDTVADDLPPVSRTVNDMSYS